MLDEISEGKTIGILLQVNFVSSFLSSKTFRCSYFKLGNTRSSFSWHLHANRKPNGTLHPKIAHRGISSLKTSSLVCTNVTRTSQS